MSDDSSNSGGIQLRPRKSSVRMSKKVGRNVSKSFLQKLGHVAKLKVGNRKRRGMKKRLSPRKKDHRGVGLSAKVRRKQKKLKNQIRNKKNRLRKKNKRTTQEDENSELDDLDFENDENENENENENEKKQNLELDVNKSESESDDDDYSDQEIITKKTNPKIDTAKGAKSTRKYRKIEKVKGSAVNDEKNKKRPTKKNPSTTKNSTQPSTTKPKKEKKAQKSSKTHGARQCDLEEWREHVKGLCEDAIERREIYRDVEVCL